MDLHEIHCLFKDSAHAGDRRRKSQLCRLFALRGSSLINRHCQSHWPVLNVMVLTGIAGVSQIHNKQFGFKNSTALLGTLGPVARARVNQLWTDNPELAPSPSVRAACCWLNMHWSTRSIYYVTVVQTSNSAVLWCCNSHPFSLSQTQVAQRGVQGTKEILQKLLEGVDPPPDTKIFVVDLTLNRLE